MPAGSKRDPPLAKAKPISDGGSASGIRLITIALENVEYPWDVQTSMLLLLGLLNVVRVSFRVKQLLKNITQRSTPMRSTAATQTPAIGTVATQSLVTSAAAEPENQPIQVSVASLYKKKWTQKSTCLVKDDETGPSQEQEEETETEITTSSLSLSDLGSLSREGVIDKVIGKGTQALSLWRRLLSGVRERYPFKEDVICHPGKWTTVERGIQYLRELAVWEMVYYDQDNVQLPTDPDEVQCTQPMWWRFVQSAPLSYAKSLAVLAWKDKVNEVAGQLWQYKKICLPPYGTVSQLWNDCLKNPKISSRNCPSRSSNSKRLTVVEAEVSLTGNEWQKHPIVPGPEATCIFGIDCLRRGYFKDPKGYRWAFGIAALEKEEIKQLSTLSDLSEDPSIVGLLRVEEQQVPIATTTVHRWQYHTNRDSLIPIHKLICQLESQGVISRTCSPFNSPIWPVQKSNGEWRQTVDNRGLNEVTLLMSAAVPDMLELQYELESKAAKWYVTTGITNVFFSIPLAAECRPQFAFTWRGVQYTWNRLPRGGNSPTICHGLIQTALEQGEAPEHLQYIDDIIVWGNSAEVVSEKGITSLLAFPSWNSLQLLILETLLRSSTNLLSTSRPHASEVSSRTRTGAPVSLTC
ncbi:hypothetical protein GRJ2_002915900 [Grus japonensis]|uniref:ribonuclease H n=1 Tax=Grus japonensis TaxID=30415 RepID=A0ABC9Y376_GRUJA